jgi:hypothetical protein
VKVRDRRDGLCGQEPLGVVGAVLQVTQHDGGVRHAAAANVHGRGALGDPDPAARPHHTRGVGSHVRVRQRQVQGHVHQGTLRMQRPDRAHQVRLTVGQPCNPYTRRQWPQQRGNRILIHVVQWRKGDGVMWRHGRQLECAQDQPGHRPPAPPLVPTSRRQRIPFARLDHSRVRGPA